MKSNKGLLFIEPVQPPSAEPIIDGLTCRMAAHLGTVRGVGIFDGEHFRNGEAYKGWHTCSCGAQSGNQDYLLLSGEVVNSLCVHYLAFHRHEVPQDQLERVAALPVMHRMPTQEELNGNRPTRV